MAQNWMEFEAFLWESFCDGQRDRELRLSEVELSYLKGRYPLATCRAEGQAQEDGKLWYHITLKQCDSFCQAHN